MVHVAECSFQVTSLLCNLFVYHKAARKPVACETFFQAPQATGSNLEVWGVSTSIKTCTSDPTEREREREMVVQASRVMFLGWGVSNPFEGILTIAAYVLRGYIYILVLYNIYIIRYTSLGHRAESKLYLIFDLMLLGFLRFLAPSRLRPCRTARRHHPKTASPRHREKKINCPWR